MEAYSDESSIDISIPPAPHRGDLEDEAGAGAMIEGLPEALATELGLGTLGDLEVLECRLAFAAAGVGIPAVAFFSADARANGPYSVSFPLSFEIGCTSFHRGVL